MNLFPYDNYHNLNLDWILDKTTTAFDLSQEAFSIVSGLEDKFVQLRNRVDGVEATAELAESRAAAASAAASRSASDAQIAAESAAAVESIATQARTLASQANTTAERANTTANSAAAAASEALTEVGQSVRIVDSGTSSTTTDGHTFNWTWKKYSDGHAIIYGVMTKTTVTFSKTHGSITGAVPVAYIGCTLPFAVTNATVTGTIPEFNAPYAWISYGGSNNATISGSGMQLALYNDTYASGGTTQVTVRVRIVANYS